MQRNGGLKQEPKDRIQGKFYPLKNSEWVNCCKELTKSQLSVLYYLRSLDPYSNGIKVTASKIGDELAISKRAVNAAIAILDEKGYINLEDVEYSVRVIAGGCLHATFSTVTQVGREFPTQAENFPLGQEISHPSREFPTQAENFPLEQGISHLEPESVAVSDFENAKILKTIQDHLYQQQNESAVELCESEEVNKIIDQLKLVKCTPGLQINKQVEQAIADFLPNAQDAIAYLKECLKTWDGRRTYNWTGVFVKALKEGQKPNFPIHTQGGLLKIPDCPEELKQWFQTVDQSRFTIFYSETRHSWMAIDNTSRVEQLYWQDAIIQWGQE